MSIAPGIRTALAADADITTAVSTRIYFVKLPQEPTYPAITIQLISGDPHNTVAELQSLHWCRVRIYAWAKTIAAADALSGLIETALNGQTIDTATHLIRSVYADGIRDFYEPEVAAYYSMQDFRIWYRAV